jgi:hypothetical protein
MLDGKEQKQPVLLKLKPGDLVSLVVSRPGYATQNVVVTDQDDTKLITLAPLPGTKVTKPTTTKPAGGGTDLTGLGPDPFEKKR